MYDNRKLDSIDFFEDVLLDDHSGIVKGFVSESLI